MASQTSLASKAAEVQQLAWQLSTARRATLSHKDDLVHAGRTIATLTQQLQVKLCSMLHPSMLS